MTLDLTTWLRGVLDEDETDERELNYLAGSNHGRFRLADIAAKRAIIDAYELAEKHTEFGADDWRIGNADGLRYAVQRIATAYARRPDYRDEWRP